MAALTIVEIAHVSQMPLDIAIQLEMVVYCYRVIKSIILFDRLLFAQSIWISSAPTIAPF